MLTYDKAKELKEAGFPQTSHLGVDKKGNYYNYYHNIPMPEHVCIPILTELMDACGEEHEGYDFCLIRTDDGWKAYYADKNYHEVSTYLEMGTTPEEAVANLWLSLNRKSDA